MSILEELNPAQRQAAETVDGPLLVLAGAGSGKTRVLTYRLAYLVRERGVSPRNILAATFTKKAAGEMRERVEGLVGELAAQLWIGTFHSICARLLRFEAHAFELDPSFTIYDEEDRRTLMRQVLANLQIDPKELAPRTVIAQISRAKNAMLDPQSFAQEAGEAPRRRQLTQLYTAYEAELRRNNAFDFDDLLVEVVRQLQNHPEVLARYQERFRFILVDEYQDTNRPQYLLCRLLAAGHRNLCVVGDDDQSIYQFRGADIRNILDFERDYPEAKVVRLEQNYRSTGRILAAANALIRHNRDRKGKELWTAAGDGEPLQVIECDTDRGEARYVVDTLKRLVDTQQYTPGDLAVLYRTNAQSRPLEEELQRSGMPYLIVGSIRFYERKEVKDILAYLRLLANPTDDLTLRRIINTPRRGIGTISIQQLQTFAQQHGLSLKAALGRLEQIPAVNGRARKQLAGFAGLLERLDRARETLELAELGEAVYEQSGYRQMLQEEGTPEAEVRAQNVDELIAFMTEFAETRQDADLETFLEEVALMAPTDTNPEGREKNAAITLMTLHSAKGLEFPVVFLCGLEENLFPTSRAVEESHLNPQAIEEERRLCYVGITRARERLLLTCARQRYTFGALIPCEASRFLDELPAELLSVNQHQDRRRFSDRKRHAAPGQAARRIRSPDAGQPSASRPTGIHYEWEAQPEEEPAAKVDADDFLAVGQWVRHPKWGRGQVIARSGHGPEMKLSIRFDGSQIKKVVAGYARLQPA